MPTTTHDKVSRGSFVLQRAMFERIILGLASILAVSEFILENPLLTLSSDTKAVLNILSIMIAVTFVWWTDQTATTRGKNEH